MLLMTALRRSGWLIPLVLFGGYPPAGATPGLRACLAAHCDSLVGRQLPSGAFTERNAFWWEIGIATRALLAGYRTLGDDRYLRAAERAVDRFRDEQNYDGGWYSYVYDTVRPEWRISSNLADLSVMASCLSLLAPEVDSTRARSYVQAHRRFIEHVVPRHDHIGGSFFNGWFQGNYDRYPYSVATATAAQSLISLFQATGQRSYLRRAEVALRYLLADLGEDGSFTFHPHSSAKTSKLAATDFHNSYYLLEAVLWVYRNTSDEELQVQTRAKLLDYLWGTAGLLEQLRDPSWIDAPADPGHAKAYGMVGILSALGHVLGPVAGVDPYVQTGLQALCGGAVMRRQERGAADFAFAALSLAEVLAPQTAVLDTR